MKSCIILLFVFLSINCSASDSCRYSRMYTYQCYSPNGNKLKRPELIGITLYNASGNNIGIINFISDTLESLKIYNLDSMGDNIGFYGFNASGQMKSKHFPLEDSIHTNDYPFIEVSTVNSCAGANVKCKRNSCGNVIEKTVTSTDNPKFIISRLKYVYE